MKQSPFPYCFKIAQSRGKWEWKPTIIFCEITAHFVTKAKAKVKSFQEMLESRWDFTERRHFDSEKPPNIQDWQKMSEVLATCKTRVYDMSRGVSVLRQRCNDQTLINYWPINCSRWVSMFSSMRYDKKENAIPLHFYSSFKFAFFFFNTSIFYFIGTLTDIARAC